MNKVYLILSYLSCVFPTERVSSVSVTPNTTELLEFNSSVRISCHVSTGTSLSYLWMNGSSEITVSSDRVQVGDGGTSLTILNVSRYDRGPYTCNVSNPVSNDVGRPLTLTIGCEFPCPSCVKGLRGLFTNVLIGLHAMWWMLSSTATIPY